MMWSGRLMSWQDDGVESFTALRRHWGMWYGVYAYLHCHEMSLMLLLYADCEVKSCYTISFHRTRVRAIGRVRVAGGPYAYAEHGHRRSSQERCLVAGTNSSYP